MSQPDATAPGTLRFRPIEPADETLLYEIYASTRAEEMALVQHWTAEQRTGFLTQQFQAQHRYYHEAYQYRDYSVILLGNQQAGRLYLDHRPTEVRIVDITLLPDFRNNGLGERILRGVLQEAAGAGKMVTIHVERTNPARNLYERLGFRIIDESNQVYLLLEWKP